MGVNLQQVRALWVRPALAALGEENLAAENLVLGTGNAESGYEYMAQLGGGPARGFWQMEQATHDDIWLNYLRFRPRLASLLGSLGGHFDYLVTRPVYAAAMCRVDYMRASSPLPSADDAAAQAEYHKNHYNTALGAADPMRNRAIFQEAINA
ncbi:hypothetical protein [Acetobacter sp. UBA5411]|uniref:hypothetical protein n=1 Tax=Acetobacter sp. UBA5411 TaxID=1945905 RepID=UPI0025C2E0B8|nr:hypothetical protein [Acetobacter sp. UBA5411]